VISAQGFVTSAWTSVTSSAGFGERARGFVMIVPGGVTSADDPGKLAVPAVTSAKGAAKAV